LSYIYTFLSYFSLSLSLCFLYLYHDVGAFVCCFVSFSISFVHVLFILIIFYILDIIIIVDVLLFVLLYRICWCIILLSYRDYTLCRIFIFTLLLLLLLFFYLSLTDGRPKSRLKTFRTTSDFRAIVLLL